MRQQRIQRAKASCTDTPPENAVDYDPFCGCGACAVCITWGD